jgi:uncharacterized protein with HEPN domain
MRDDAERLRDMLEAIERIERRTRHDAGIIERDELVRVWVVHHLQIIGEAARALSQEYRDRHADVPWADVVGTRNILVHHYFEIDLDLVSEIVTDDLPPLKTALERLLEYADDSD